MANRIPLAEALRWADSIKGRTVSHEWIAQRWSAKVLATEVRRLRRELRKAQQEVAKNGY